MSDETGTTKVVAQGPSPEAVVATKIPRSVAVASGGIRTTRDAGNVLSAIVTDVLSGDLQPKIANVAVSAIGKMVAVKELALKHGGEAGTVTLADDAPVDAKSRRRLELQEELARLN